jgi:hypothetical protein
MRFASLEASLKRIDDTITERLEGVAVLVSQHLQAIGSRQSGGDAGHAAPALEQHLQRIDRQLASRLDELESRMTQPAVLNGLSSAPSGFVDFDPFSPVAAYHATSEASEAQPMRELTDRVAHIDGRLEQITAQARHDIAELGAMLVRLDRRLDHPDTGRGTADVTPAVDAALRRVIESIGRRLDGIEVWLRQHGEHVGMAFTDLSQRLEVRSVNNSVFDDFASASSNVPLDSTFGAVSPGPNSLQSLMLNLAHLQVDLRAERSQLRKRLRDLGNDPPPAAASGT